MLFFFFNDTATTEIYTLSLHDALPIFSLGIDIGGTFTDLVVLDPSDGRAAIWKESTTPDDPSRGAIAGLRDRKSTRLNSSHANISYAVFCLKKKNDTHKTCSCF